MSALYEIQLQKKGSGNVSTRRDFMRAGAASLALLRIDPAFGKLTGSNQQELWYSQPAKRWLEALPLGNGRLGAMVFGGAASERIALSESTAWSGEPGTSEVNPGARTHLAEIRQLMFTGNYSEANRLCRRYLLPHSRNCLICSRGRS